MEIRRILLFVTLFIGFTYIHTQFIMPQFMPPPQPVGDLGEHNVDVDLDELDDLMTVSGQVRPSSTLSEHSDPARGLAPTRTN